MQKVNKIIFLFINIIWAVAIIISLVLTVKGDENLRQLTNLVFFSAIAAFQLYAGIKLWKNNLIIPMIATAFFLVNINLEGFKYVTTTFCYFLFEIHPTGVTINGTILGDPTILTNLSFSPIVFNSISINIAVLVQIGLLLYQYDYRKQ